MLDYTNCNIEKVSVHFVGNKVNDEELQISKSLLDISDLKVRELLFKFCTLPFSNPEFYSFTFPDEDFTLNPVYNLAAQIFDSTKLFQKTSVSFAKLLYDVSNHPQIKAGDFIVVYFKDIGFDDELVDAIGIYKSESKQSFLTLDMKSDAYSAMYEEGINIDNLDKGCIILNTEKDSGYRICIVDKSNKSLEAQYWKDEFLKLKPINNEYNQTKEFLSLTKEFVTKKLAKEFDVDKTEQINFLNKSVEYFKSNDSFNRRSFEKEVFNDRDIIKSFRNFNEDVASQSRIELADNFEISSQAVKRQTKIFKSVLKLDKNFHIYIHGNTELIEKGVELDGRKFYKIYYDNEV